MIKWCHGTVQCFVVLVHWMFKRFLLILQGFDSNLDISQGLKWTVSINQKLQNFDNTLSIKHHHHGTIPPDITKNKVELLPVVIILQF